MTFKLVFKMVEHLVWNGLYFLVCNLQSSFKVKFKIKSCFILIYIILFKDIKTFKFYDEIIFGVKSFVNV